MAHFESRGVETDAVRRCRYVARSAVAVVMLATATAFGISAATGRAEGMPVAVVEANPNPALIGQMIRFDGSSSFHQDPNFEVVAWDWDLDNDSIYEVSGPITFYPFYKIGDFPVTLRVTDDKPTPDYATTSVTQVVGTFPIFVEQPLDQSVAAGGTASFSALVVGWPAPMTYQWQHDGQSLIDGGDLDGSTTSVLTISNVHAGHMGSYSVACVNYFGSSVSDSAMLMVLSEPLNGDFDMDGDVDGSDFLLWQTDPSIGLLSDWEADYGTVLQPPLEASSAVVPEPSTTALCLLALAGGWCRRYGRAGRLRLCRSAQRVVNPRAAEESGLLLQTRFFGRPQNDIVGKPFSQNTAFSGTLFLPGWVEWT